MPKPMHRSGSVKRVQRITSTKKVVTHYRRAKPSAPHCALCSIELNGISVKGGSSRRSNNRLFGGVLCAGCTGKIVKLGSRIEQGDMKLTDISIRQRAYVLQMLAH